MLRKIAVAQLDKGMFLHRLEGRWLDHSVWRSKFLIADDKALARLRDSGVRECWIDLSKGRDLPPPPPPAAAVAASEPAAPELTAPPSLHAGEHSMAEELPRAAAICQRARQAVTSMFNEARMGRALDAQQCLPLVDEISNSVLRNPGALVSLARLKTKDDYTYMHSVAVCALMVALARQLGHSDEQCRVAGMAGLLHDLGKARVPRHILDKPGKLDDEEWKQVRQHPAWGHEMLLEGQGVDEVALDTCLHHHERFDGGGYPHGLRGEQISLHARMGAICDVYDAISSNRPYKAGWDPAEAISRMASWKGHFDEGLFAAFVHSLGIFPNGALVRLESGRLAMVVEQNPQRLTHPVVNVFYSLQMECALPVRRVDLSAGGGNDRIVSRESPAKYGFANLNDFWLDADTQALLKA